MASNNRKNQRLREAATELFDSLDDRGFEGWLCVREQDDNARIRDWSFLAAKSPKELFQLMFQLMEIVYLIDEDEE